MAGEILYPLSRYEKGIVWDTEFLVPISSGLEMTVSFFYVLLGALAPLREKKHLRLCVLARKVINSLRLSALARK